MSRQTKVLDKQELKRLISRNLIISVLAKIFYLLPRMFLPPLTLHFVSLEEYGLWVICFILIGYLGSTTFSVANVYIRYVAEYHAKHQIEKINGLISTGMVLMSFICLLILVGLFFLLPPIVTKLFKIPDKLHHTAFILFYGTLCMFMLQISLGGFMYVLNGLQKIAETTFIAIVCLSLETILVVVFLLTGFGIYGLLYAFIIRSVLSTLSYTYFSFRLVPGLVVSFKFFDAAYFKLFYRFGTIMQIAGLINIFFSSIHKLIAGTTLNVESTALLDIGTKIPTVATGIPDSMNAVFLPATSYMYSQQRQHELIAMYTKGSRYMSLLTGAMMGFLAAFASPIITGWMGTDDKFHVAAVIMVALTLPQHIHVLTGPGTSYFNGIEKPLHALIYPLTSIALIGIGITTNAGLHLFDIDILNIVLVFGLSISLGGLMFILYANDTVGLSQKQYATQVLIPGLVPYVVGFMLAWLLTPWIHYAAVSRWQSIYCVLGSCTIYAIVIAGVIYLWFLNAQEKGYVKARFRKILDKVSRQTGTETS